MTRDYSTISVERDGETATVTVDRPDAMNAVNTEVLGELADAVSAADADESVGAIVVTGRGDDAFIGGGDIKEFQNQSAVWFKSEFRSEMARVEDAIEGGRTPVLAAVNGVALGGGTEIALMCDIVLTAESARFGLPEIGLGIIPGAGGTQRLAHLVGFLKAKELILTGKHVPAPDAVDIGLANEVVPDDEFDDRVAEFAAELADGPAVAQWFAKEAINQTRANLDAGVELEKALAAILFETADKEEGLSAFVERRDPEFVGE